MSAILGCHAISRVPQALSPWPLTHFESFWILWKVILVHSLFFLLNFLLARREGFVFRSFASSSLTSDPPRSLCQPSLAAMPYQECHRHSRHGRLLTSNPSRFYGRSFLCIVYFFIEFDTGAPGRPTWINFSGSFSRVLKCGLQLLNQVFTAFYYYILECYLLPQSNTKNTKISLRLFPKCSHSTSKNCELLYTLEASYIIFYLINQPKKLSNFFHQGGLRGIEIY